MQKLTVLTLACSTSLGCLIDAENAGVVASTSDGPASAGAGDDTETGGEEPMVDPNIDWILELEQGYVRTMVRSPSGIVVVIRVDGGTIVREYSASMDISWSIELADSTVADINPLGSGYIMGGTAPIGEGPDPERVVATAWRLSCCGTVELTQAFPPDADDEHTGIVVAEPHAGGLLLARDHEGSTTQIIRTNLELEQQWLVEQDFVVWDGALTPAGDVVLVAVEDIGTVSSTFWFYEIAADGTSMSAGPLDWRPLLVGSGAALSNLNHVFGGGLTVHPYGGGPSFAVDHDFGSVAGSEVWDRGDRFAFADSIEVPLAESYFGNITNVVEFDESGTVARQVPIHASPPAHTLTSVLAVGSDGAIYIVYITNEPGGLSPGAPQLARIAPL